MKLEYFQSGLSGNKCFFACGWMPKFCTRHVQKLLAIFLLMQLFEIYPIKAENLYVTPTGAGSKNGSDWNNAFAGFDGVTWGGGAGQLGAGDTLWVAAGSYGLLTMNGDGTSGNQLIIKRARSTNSECSSASGWSSAYDGLVTINGVRAFNSNNYWTLDGQIPHSGITVTNTSLAQSVINFSSAVASGIVLRNLLITSGVTNQTMTGVDDIRCINANFTSSGTGNGLLVSDCILQQTPTFISILNWKNVTIERCKFWRNFAGNSGFHPNTIQVIGCTNWVFRYNEVTKYLSEGIMMCFNGPGDAPNDNWDIYGNCWHDDEPGWYGRILESQYVPQKNIRFYNNTAVNLSLGISTANGGSWGTGCVATNNLAYNLTAGEVNFGTGTYGSNLVSMNSFVFQDYTNGNYNIVSNVGALYPRNAGVNLGTNYAIDLVGNTRPSIGNWTIGAYEGGTNSSVATHIILWLPVRR
jgi:hypothetical protein